jgi:hypothetical protein
LDVPAPDAPAAPAPPLGPVPPAAPGVAAPELPPALLLPVPYCCRHLVRSAPVMPTHWLGVAPLAPEVPEAPLPVLPDELLPELMPELPEDAPVPLLPELPLLVCANAAVATNAERIAALMSFKVMDRLL